MDFLLTISILPAFMAISALTIRKIRVLSIILAIFSWIYLAQLAWHLIPYLVADNLQEIYMHDIYLPAGFRIDKLAAGFILLTSFISACVLTQARKFFEGERERDKESNTNPGHIQEFYICVSLLLLAMIFVFICDNLGYLWIALEATTLLSAALVYFKRDKHAIEAAWKYLIICSVGIAFGLLGTVFIFSASRWVPGLEQGSLNISELLDAAPAMNNELRRLGFIFCMLGYGTKAGMFPLHSWLPDAYSEAPAPASAMLSGTLINCALFAIFRLSEINRAASYSRFSLEIVIWSGTITVLAASLFLVRQHGLKRLWAYSSVENVGLMLIAIGLGSGQLFFLLALNHSIAKASLFISSGNIIQITGTKQLSRMRGLLTSAPLNSTALILSALAVTGIPPFGAFVAELILLVNLGSSCRWVPFALLILGLSLSFIAIAFHLGRILYGNPKPRGQEREIPGNCLVPALMIASLLILGITMAPLLVLK